MSTKKIVELDEEAKKQLLRKRKVKPDKHAPDVARILEPYTSE
jgi:hypothetical protein